MKKLIFYYYNNWKRRYEKRKVYSELILVIGFICGIEELKDMIRFKISGEWKCMLLLGNYICFCVV